MVDRFIKAGFIFIILSATAFMLFVVKGVNRPLVTPEPEIITLHAYNTVSLREPVTDESMAELVADATQKVENLDANFPLYLVLNTPGGSVGAGLAAFQSLKALNHEIKTISMFAASMGFYAVQFLGERLILPNGVIMAHPISLGGVEGPSLPIIRSRLAWIQQEEDSMKAVACRRSGYSIDEFTRLSVNEYWGVGQKAVDDRFADRVVLAKCGHDLDGFTESKKEMLVLGIIPIETTVKVSDCPLK